jgi:hypothetical protein
MKHFSIKAVLTVCALGITVHGFAGNKDRSGQAGATELLVNPWGQSTGLFGQNTACVKGIEAMKCNIAGLAFVDKTEFGLSYTDYIKGSGVTVTNFAFAQKVGEAGVIGFNLMSMGFGDVDVTDYNHPEGGVGTFKPEFYNLSLGYAKKFSNNICAGAAVTIVQEGLTNISATGACFEAGVQYVTGKRDNFHFGITLRNVGTNMRFSGDGFATSFENVDNTNASYGLNRDTRAEKFEMPTYLSFGASYDLYLDDIEYHEAAHPNHRLTPLFNFTSNSFNNDYIGGGLEYAFKETIMLRGSYRYEANINDAALSTTLYTGFSFGATAQKAIGEKGPRLAVDYSFRPTQKPANGVHTFTLRFMRR